jgi:hypothetical protein
MKYEYLVKMSIDQLIPYFITQTIIVVLLSAIPFGIIYWIYGLIMNLKPIKILFKSIYK